MKAIIASPIIFPPTQVSYAMADELEKVIQGFGWDVVRLRGPENIRLVFSYVLRYHPDAVLTAYMGHANPTMFMGEEIAGPGILAVDNVAEAKGHIIVGLPACLSAQQLGPATVRAGAKAFAGSMEEMYAAWSEQEHNYMADWFDYTLTFYKSLVGLLTAGKTVEEAMSKALADYRERCSHFEQLYKQHLQDWPNADFYLHAVKQNRDFFVEILR